jgi:hypothetical protein
MRICHIALAAVVAFCGVAHASLQLSATYSRETGRITLTAVSRCDPYVSPGTVITFYHVGTNGPYGAREPLIIGTATLEREGATLTIDGLGCGIHSFLATEQGKVPRLDVLYPFGYPCEGAMDVTVSGKGAATSVESLSTMPGGWISAVVKGQSMCVGSLAYFYERVGIEWFLVGYQSIRPDLIRILLPPRERPPLVTIEGPVGDAALLVPKSVPSDSLVAELESYHRAVVTGFEPGASIVFWDGSVSLLRDLNGDGAVRHSMGERAVFVDPRSGAFRILVFTGIVNPLPAGMLQGAVNGRPTRLVASSSVLWVRPGVGVWQSGGRPYPTGETGLPNQFTTSQFTPAGPEVPAPPESFAPDDVLFLGGFYSLAFGRVGDLLADHELAGPFTVAVDDVHVASPTAGAANFTVRLSRPAPTPVRVHYSTIESTARAGVDFTPAWGTLVFEPGEVEKQVDVPLLGGAGSDRVFALRLFDAVGAVPTWDRALAFLDHPQRRRAVRR